MTKFNGKIYLSLAVILILLASGKGLLARAAIIEETEIDLDKKIKITGACDNGILNVQILSATSSQPFYTAGIACHENKFEFKDDLRYWHIPDGDYNITIFGKDGSLVSSSTAAFKIQSPASPVSVGDIIDPIVGLENSSVGVQEDDAVKIETFNQGEASGQAAILENPSDGLFTQVINFLMEWLKSAVVMIKELVVEKITAPELCLGKTCIVEDQLKYLLGGKSGHGEIPFVAGQKIEASAPEPEIQMSAPSSAGDATTTAN